jgi:hypothetical protein
MSSPGFKIHNFDQGPVITAQVALGYFVAFEPGRPDVRGRGATMLSSIAALNRAIEEAGSEDEEDDRPLTGQDLQDWKWDHDRDSRKHEVA